MQTLPVTFTIGKYEMVQIERTNQAALYQQGRFHWEVVLIETSPPCRIFDKDYPEREVYPSSEKWGSAGWTFQDLPSAKSKFREVGYPSK